MKINYITGPAGCGKTRHLQAIRAEAFAAGRVVIGPVTADCLERVLVPPHGQATAAAADRSTTVLLVDECVMTGVMFKRLVPRVAAADCKEVFLSGEGARNTWGGLQ